MTQPRCLRVLTVGLASPILIRRGGGVSSLVDTIQIRPLQCLNKATEVGNRPVPRGLYEQIGNLEHLQNALASTARRWPGPHVRFGSNRVGLTDSPRLPVFPRKRTSPRARAVVVTPDTVASRSR